MLLDIYLASLFIAKRKLSDLQDLAYNLVREFDKISDNFYQAAKAYESSEDRINNLVNINKNNDIRKMTEIPFQTCPHCEYILKGFHILSNS